MRFREWLAEEVKGGMDWEAAWKYLQLYQDR